MKNIRGNSRIISRAMLAGVAAIAIAACNAPAWAQAGGPAQINVPAQSLSSALNRLGRQTNTEIVFAPAAVRGLRAPALQGRFTVEQALERLLSGSGLRFRTTGQGAFVVERGSGEAQAGGAAAENENVDAEILVTAQRREERLIDAPQSVSVITAANIRQLNATQFRDFADTVPGLSFATSGAGYNRVALRGVTTGSDLGPTVGIYVDEVPYGSSSSHAAAATLALDVGLFDLQRIEVLRGPQGTLYGASTMGGLLKYVTNRPQTDSIEGDVQVGLSDTHLGGTSYNGAAAVNLPIVSGRLAVRASGFYSHDGGYIDNVALGQRDVNRSNIYGGRIDILATPTDALTIRVTGFAQNIARQGTALADYSLAGVRSGPDLTQSRLIGEPFDSKFRLVSGQVDYNLGPATLTSITSYQTAHTINGVDSSFLASILNTFFGRNYIAVGGPAGIFTDKFTQEVRLASQGHQLEWLVGGFFTNEISRQTEDLILLDPTRTPAPNDVLTGNIPSRYKEYAAFGHVTYHFTPQFDVSAGARYASNRQRFSRDEEGLLGSDLPETRSRDHRVTYLADARYRFADRVTGYLRFATAYRPGGPNFANIDRATGLPVGATTFEPDHLSSYEAGIRGETRGRTFYYDLSAYYIDWSNIQLLGFRNGASAIVNAPGGATVRGAELTVTARPIPDLSVTGAFAYQDAHLSAANPDLGARAGERLPLTPKFSATVNADYRISAAALQPRIGATLRHVSDRTSSFDASVGNPQYHLPDYVTLDLRGGLTLAGVDAQIFVRNLFDTRPQVSAVTFQTFAGLPAQVSILQPRTIGVSLATHF